MAAVENQSILPAILFPIGLWLFVTTLLSALSGWWQLAAAFPNRDDVLLVRLRWCSGKMGLTNYGSILTLTACQSGLRVGVNRLFGPFCRSFFVPWQSIAVTRRTTFLWPRAELQFGRPWIGTLTISNNLADRLARAAVEHWPEAGPFPPEPTRAIALRYSALWAIATTFAALFFTVVPRVMAPRAVRPPVAVAVLFPAIGFGVAFLVQFLKERRASLGGVERSAAGGQMPNRNT
jgi:hypothetical protein